MYIIYTHNYILQIRKKDIESYGCDCEKWGEQWGCLYRHGHGGIEGINKANMYIFLNDLILI